MAHELKRAPRGDGRTEVTVALGAVDTVVLVVHDEHVGQAGYDQMLDLAVARHVRNVNMREGLPA